jgi:hypothetical protein
MLSFARFLLHYFKQLGFLGASVFSAENLQKFILINSRGTKDVSAIAYSHLNDVKDFNLKSEKEVNI